jgi:hypothetical protein
MPATIWSPFEVIIQSDGGKEIQAILVNVKQTANMPSIDQPTRKKVYNYVEKLAVPGKNWEDNADAICHLIENGKIISEKDIVYADDGSITKIKGTEVHDGVLLLREKKKPLKATVVRSSEPIPFIEDLRRRKITVL